MAVEKQILTDKGIYRLINLDGEIRLFFPKPKDSLLEKISNTFCYYEAVDEEEAKNLEWPYKLGNHWKLKWIVNNPIKVYGLIASDNIDIDTEVLDMFMNEK